MEYPKLRYVEAFPAEMAGQSGICLRDPLHLTEKILFLPSQSFFLLSLFDGAHSIRDIQVEAMRRLGKLVYQEQIESLITQLEECYFLEGQQFEAIRQELIDQFKRAQVRKPFLAGLSYESDPHSLREELKSYFLNPAGPGLPESAQSLTRPSGAAGRLQGAIAPHIDYRRGGFCYAWAYKAIAESSDADLFIILGTAHAPTNNFFALTMKDFETPLGLAITDRQFVSKLIDFYKGPEKLFDDEFSHRGEHSIELQVVLLEFLFGEKKKFKIVPILAGSLHELILSGVSPAQDRRFYEFIGALKQSIDWARSNNQRVCIIAAADLAHIGPRFGDSFPIDSSILRKVSAEDRTLLSFAGKLDAEGFYRHILKDKDRWRVCGYPPILATLGSIDDAQGTLLKYAQRTDDGSTVTFASMVFH